MLIFKWVFSRTTLLPVVFINILSFDQMFAHGEVIIPMYVHPYYMDIIYSVFFVTGVYFRIIKRAKT